MNALKNVTAYFQADRIYDAALVQGWVAAAAGEQGIVLMESKAGTKVHIATNVPLDGPILISNKKVICHRGMGEYNDSTSAITFTDFSGARSLGLNKVPIPHFTFATSRCIYGLQQGGNLLRLSMKKGTCETPSSPYGRYEQNDHKVMGISSSRQGVIVLSRLEGRAENLLDSLPDDPSRPKARAAVLKDSDWGTDLIGPAVGGRWAHMACSERECLLSIHLRNPESMKETPLPKGLLETGPILLAADPEGQVWAATPQGLDLLAGPGAPMRFAYPGDPRPTPARLLAGEGMALIHTREGDLFMVEY